MNKNIIFPSINSEIASYKPSNFYITLNNISSSDIVKYRSSVKEYINEMLVIAHETRHYADHIATVWGQELIVKHARALNNKALNKIDEFSTIIDFVKNQKQLFYNNYYTEITNSFFTYSHGISEPWGFELKIIYKYDENGIPQKKNPLYCAVFTKTKTDRTRIARVPISIVSLLEANAIFEEVDIKLNSLSQMSEDEKLVELSIYSKYLYENIVYNKDLVLYNTILHLVSIHLNIVDLYESLSVASKISTVCLNLTDKQLNIMKINPLLNNEYSNDFLRNKDYGFIFMNILLNYVDEYKSINEYNLSSLLKCNGLSDKDEIKKECQEIFKENVKELMKFNNFQLIFLNELNKGNLIFNELEIDFSNNNIMKLYSELNIKVNFILKDTDFELLDLKSEKVYSLVPFNEFDSIEEFYSYSDFFENEFDIFSDACGI